jgi:serine/threonine protein kinase/tetratricopeptide (TPR) repeat protein
MNRTPEQQWSALSALYEEADGLRADELKAWLERLEREGNPLLPQLKLMLDARSHLETDDFLGTLPKLSSDAANASDWHEGDRVGPYRLVKPLGEGGMAEVWLAERADGAFKRQVAIKLPYPRPGRETFAARFDRERDILATLRHPHIAGLFDAGVTKEGQAWLALEYVEGQPISTFCDERKLPVRERVQLFRQVLLAVQHAHANLVIHRDLKPGNILVTSQGEVRLLDFGIAKLLEAQGDAIEETELTRQAGRSLTPRYASPEQLMGLPLTTACDVYSLGVVFYELICGERPYELKVESPAQLEHAILEVEPRAPSRRPIGEAQAEMRGAAVNGLRKLLVQELDAIALRCLEKKQSARYSSVDAVLADIDRWLAGDTVLARSPSAWYRFSKFAKRHVLAVSLGTSAVVSLAVAASVAVVFAIEARQESARAIAAKDFMLSLFQRADHEKARGASLTAREILDAGRKDLLTRLSDQPRLQAELLAGIGAIQMEMGEYVNAEATFVDAERIYSQIGMAKQEALVRAAHASNALRMGNAQKALELLQAAKAVKGAPSDDAELSVSINDVAGWIANIRGDGAIARSHFLESRRKVAKAFAVNDIRSLNSLHGMIFAERLLHNFDEALSLQSELETASVRSFGFDPKQGVSADLERSDLLIVAGHFAEASAHVKSALPRCVAALGPNEEMCRRLLLNKATSLLRLGHQMEAHELLPAIAALTNEQSSPVIRTDALLLASRMATDADTPSRKELEHRLRSLGTSGAEISLNPTMKVKALLVLAEMMMRDGRSREALNLCDRVLDPEINGLGPLPPFAAGIAKGLRGIAMLQIGDLQSALKALSEADVLLSSAIGSTHALTQLFALDRAWVLAEMGETDEAARIYETSKGRLSVVLGIDSPIYGRMRNLGDRIEAARALTRSSNNRPLQSPPNLKQVASFDFFS